MGRFNVAEVMIRPFEITDAPAIADLWMALVRHHQMLNPDLPAPALNGAGRYTHRLVEKLEDDDTVAFVAEANGQVIGFVLGMVVDLVPDIFVQERSGFLADIYVDSAYRRRGIGKALVMALRDWFRDKKITSFDWYVAAHNPAGLAFWRSIGGREVMIRMRADLGDNP